MTPERAVELINSAFSYEIEGTLMDITPIDENGDYVVKERFHIDLSCIDEEMMAKLLY